jgi:hypothetical protein
MRGNERVDSQTLCAGSSRKSGLPDLRFMVRKSGKPDFRCIHAFRRNIAKDVDGRHKAGHDGVATRVP